MKSILRSFFTVLLCFSWVSAFAEMACDGTVKQKGLVKTAGYTVTELKDIKDKNSDSSILVREHLLLAEPPGSLIDFSMLDKSEEVDWVDAKRLILMGYIKSISQQHDLTIYLLSKSNILYKSNEPQLGDVFRVSEVVDPCGIFIQSMTE